ncbi:hypothetical protein SETIT_2G383700v2 [Setaria italica]|uniref:Uncharacterized protein n=2 Tax=Setaria TaxID=4554 RepID=A0A368Q7S4_SETIT|nr:hypothetical protein SETIT_2G383700v2 [Setaria italica]TKW35721.1 hypothetical protein SEVIR_2G394100v2 [Setaria viridis]
MLQRMQAYSLCYTLLLRSHITLHDALSRGQYEHDVMALFSSWMLLLFSTPCLSSLLRRQQLGLIDFLSFFGRINKGNSS